MNRNEIEIAFDNNIPVQKKNWGNIWVKKYDNERSLMFDGQGEGGIVSSDWSFTEDPSEWVAAEAN